MFVYLHRQETHPSMPASKAGTRLRRVAATLAAVAAGLLASAAAIPAAFARDIPDPLPDGQYRPIYPAPASTVHAVSPTGGVAGWQIALIALGAALIAAAVTIVLVRARAAHRAAPTPAA